MLVQSCPAPPTGGLGLQSGGLNLQSGGLPNGLAAYQSSAYCGLAPSDSSDYSSSSMQDISLPIAHQDLVNGNREEEEEEDFNDELERRSRAVLNGRNSPGFLQVESDILVTESQVLNIETTITETFTVNSNEMQDDFDLRSKTGENSEGLFVNKQVERSEGNKGSTALDSLDIYSDRFERAFEFEGNEEESFEGMPMSPGSPTSSLSSVRSRRHEEEEEEEVSVRRRDEEGGAALLGEVQKKSCLDVAAGAKVEKANDDSESGEGAKVREGETIKVRVMEGETERVKVKETEVMKVKEGEVMKVKEGEVERSSGHRVTFNDQNEVASQDRDGTFKVTYRQLGERLRRGDCEEGRGVESRLREEGKRAAALRCVVGERSRLENAGLAPRSIDFDTCSYDDLADYALPSERREMRREQGEWDNPFQPEGEVSQDAEVIVQLWKGGRLCQDSLAADLASAAASAESSLNGSLAASPGVSPASSPAHSASPPHLQHLSNNSNPLGGEGESHQPSSSPPPPPVRGNVPSTTQLVLSEKQKHKNKLKKHCNMM